MVMECIEDHIDHKIGDPKDKDADYWFQQLNSLGALPMRVLAKDRDRFIVALYAACFMHSQGLTWNAEADKRNPGPDISNPDFDPNAENVAQDGKHWGMRLETQGLPKRNVAPGEAIAHNKPAAVGSKPTPIHPEPFHDLQEQALKKEADRKAAERGELLEATKLSKRAEPVGTVREQVESKTTSDLEKFLGSETPMGQLEAIRHTGEDTYIQKWAIAERLARKPREAWEQAPWELRKMTEYCIGWIKDTGAVPYYPKDLIEIWWKRPTASVINMTPVAIARRDAIVEKIRSFWTSSVESNRDKINVRSESYRVTLAAMDLEKLIEVFANGTDNEADIRQGAMKYFHAHFPIETLGVKPGPITTLDPNFIEYMKLCQKYNLQVGTLLHEAQL